MDLPDTRIEGKMELLARGSELLPAGKPKFLDVVKYPKIEDLITQHGKTTIQKVVFLMVKDFAGAFNVVRNLTEDQMIECAAMLLDECDNFRLEDYVMMFQMGKRGELVKVYDRIDISVITEMLDAYWGKRKLAAIQAEDEIEKKYQGIGPVIRDEQHPQDAKLLSGSDSLAGAMGELKNAFKNWKENQ